MSRAGWQQDSSQGVRQGLRALLPRDRGGGGGARLAKRVLEGTVGLGLGLGAVGEGLALVWMLSGSRGNSDWVS